MVAAGAWMLLLMVLGFYYNAKRVIEKKRWLLRRRRTTDASPELGPGPWRLGAKRRAGDGLCRASTADAEFPSFEPPCDWIS